jgi:hypothetical protein
MVIFSALSLPGLVACGDDETLPTEFETPSGQITITDAIRGLPVEPMTSVETAVDVFTTDLGTAGSTTLTVQLFDEVRFAASNDRRSSTLANRLDDFWFLENPSGRTGVGQTIINSGKPVTLVVDIQRRDREWLVDWEGGVRDEPGNRETSFTFQFRESAEESDYQQHMIEQITETLNLVDVSGTPVTRLVFGTELERHYAAAPQDWSYVCSFVRQLEASLAQSHPAVQLSVGINWSNFYESLVPAFLPEGAAADALDYSTLRRAWRQIIDPLYFTPEALARIDADGSPGADPVLDFYAFSSIPDVDLYGRDPANVAENHYAGIGTIFHDESFRSGRDLVWFQVGWPINSDNSETAGRFLQRFLQLSSFADSDGQPNVAVISWWGFNHSLEAECNQLTGSTIGADGSLCFRGLYPTVPQVSAQNQLLRSFFNRQ